MLNILQNNSTLSQQGYWQNNIDQLIDLFRFPVLLRRLYVCVFLYIIDIVIQVSPVYFFLT